MNDYDDDVELDIEDDVEVDDEDTAGTPDEGETEDKPEPKKKDDLPEGVVTPTGLTHLVNDDSECLATLKELGKEAMTPQQMYGYVKTGKDFPHSEHTDGRVIVPVEDGLTWVRSRLAAQLGRRKAKAEKDAQKEAKAAEGASTAPEVAGEEPVEVD